MALPHDATSDGTIAAATTETVVKAYRDGTDRTVDPETTLARFLPHRSTMGITRVADVTGLDHVGIPVACAVRPLSRNLAVSQGKGLTRAAAMTSAFMESAEMWHAQQHPHDVIWASVDAMRANDEPMVEVERVLRWEGASLEPDKPFRWVAGYDLVAQTTKWVPYEAVHCDGRLPKSPGEEVFRRGSNGLASGNHRLEAICHALYELVERDELATWYEAADLTQRTRRVALDTVDDAACAGVIERFRAAGVEPAVWDVALGPWAVPTYVCLAGEREAATLHPFPAGEGSGSHPTRAVALLRALTEAAQVRATVISGSRDDIDRSVYDDYWYSAESRAYIDALSRDETPYTFGATPEADHVTFNDDLAWLLERLRAGGIEEVVVVDYTNDDIELPVVKIVVPGLRNGG
jgi:ribosomal protein S12 methylthiotransferase accessory factor